MELWIWVVGSYFSGSVPFALLIGLAHGVDIRKVGSGNVGTTNVGRALGRKWGVLCLILDVMKGLLPVLVGGLVLGYANRRDLPAEEAWRWMAIGAAAVVGHVFPIWLKFKGGKGVATSLGVLLGFWPILTLPGVGVAVVWVIVVKLSKYVSLASVMAAVSLPLFAWVHAVTTAARPWDRLPFIVVGAALALLVVVRHRTNITRLMAGTENRVGAKK